MKFKYTIDNNYFVSDNGKLAFLNIPKNASTSIRNTLNLTKRLPSNKINDDAFRFAIIRNPLDRFVSSMIEVSLLRDDGDFELTKSLKWYAGFIKAQYRFAVHTLLDELEVIGCYDEHLLSQSDCLGFRNIYNIKELDFILDFDYLDRDFKTLSNMINIKRPLYNHRKSDKKIFTTLRNIVNEEAIINKITNLYSKDFELYKQIKR